MAEEKEGTEPKKPEGSAPARTPIVFVSDPSAEAERISQALRTSGYVVADVPVSSLIARAVVQRPNVVVVDVDADGVLDELVRLRRAPGSGAIDFVYLGGGEGRIKDADDALENDGSAFFLRPVDVAGLVRKVEALTGGPSRREDVRPSTPPPSIGPKRSPSNAPSRPPSPAPSRPPSDRPSAPSPSLPAPGLRTPGPPLPMSTTSLADLVDAPRSIVSFGTVSQELQQLLAEAELRAEVMSSPEPSLPSPEEEIEAVLPADVLASLDEPIDGDEDEEQGPEGRASHGAQHDRDGTGAHAKGTTSGGSRQPTTGSGSGNRVATGAQTHERRVGSDSPPRPSSQSPSTSPGTGASRKITDPAIRTDAPRSERYDIPPVSQSPRTLDPSWAPTGTWSRDASPPSFPVPSISTTPPYDGPIRGPSMQPSPTARPPIVVGPGDARRFFAEAIARRSTGALCFESEGTVRRIVMREGDLVCAASGGEHESLVHFLSARGELPRDEAPRLANKIPPYGRHAGAALVAHGWLRQDQLWTVLRAHAEWIATFVIRITGGTALLEPDPPGRLKSEPSVFGASTGPEIFVELVRRAVPPVEALERLGGDTARITVGPNPRLLAECNLAPQDLDLVTKARGGSISELLSRAPDPEIVAVLHALTLLGVTEIVPAIEQARSEAKTDGGRRRVDPGSDPDVAVAALDEDAIRARVRARIELVEEGDYFAVLGVARDATGYEVRRAFLELRKNFEPSRILTPRLVDLSDDVRKIVVVLEEAYEILREPARRERYRRAIDARPE